MYGIPDVEVSSLLRFQAELMGWTVRDPELELGRYVVIRVCGSDDDRRLLAAREQCDPRVTELSATLVSDVIDTAYTLAGLERVQDGAEVWVRERPDLVRSRLLIVAPPRGASALAEIERLGGEVELRSATWFITGRTTDLLLWRACDESGIL